MKTNLVYHSQDSLIMDISPIDCEIRRIVTNKDINIICPYLGNEYIRVLTNLCNSWKMLTDFNAWLDSNKSIQQKRLVFDFILENRKNIRHYQNIHAKVVFTCTEAIFGSANFTMQGLYEREELCVHIKDTLKCNELSSWFNKLWDEVDQISDIDLHNIREYISSLPKSKPNNINSSQDRLIFSKPARRCLSKPNLTQVFQNTNIEIPKNSDEKNYYPITNIANEFAENENVKPSSIRKWIIMQIEKGKVKAYKYYGCYLLDDEGKNLLTILRNKTDLEEIELYPISSPNNIQILAKNQFLRLEDVARITGKNNNQIRRLVKSGIINFKFKTRTYIFDKNILYKINSLHSFPKKQVRDQIDQNLKIKVLDQLNLTPLQRYAYLLHQKGFTLDQIALQANNEGYSKGKSRENIRQVINGVKSKIQK